MLLFFIAEMAIATIGFVFPQKVTGILEKHLTSKLIEFYREDPDLQNIIDFTQQEVMLLGILCLLILIILMLSFSLNAVV